MNGHARDFTLRIDQRDALFGADKGRALTEEMHGGNRRADRNQTHAVGDGDDGSLLGGIELAHHVVMQPSKPERIACSGNSRPMKMRRLSRGSPSFHLRWWLPSSIMWTP